MSRIRVVGVSGSTRRPSRTSELVAEIGRSLSHHRSVQFDLIDLAEIGPGLGAFSRDDLPDAGRRALSAIEAADGLIVGSPVYKGSYTGLFKHLFDFVDVQALVGVPVALTATGGGRRHALTVEHQLRPLFGFFSALTLPTSVYASDEDFRDGKLADPVTIDRVRQVASELARHVSPRRSALVTPVPLERVA
jgi:FMN reductase